MDIESKTEGNVVVRIATSEDWEAAMELAWRTFLKFEAPVYGEEGTKHFLDFISEEKLFKMFLAGEYPMLVATSDNRIVGMAALRGKGHVSLLFVDEKYHHKGIGSKLIKGLLRIAESNGQGLMTVNAAPYAVEFYKRAGFVASGDETKADGITYTPMMYAGGINN